MATEREKAKARDAVALGWLYVVQLHPPGEAKEVGGEFQAQHAISLGEAGQFSALLPVGITVGKLGRACSLMHDGVVQEAKLVDRPVLRHGRKVDSFLLLEKASQFDDIRRVPLGGRAELMCAPAAGGKLHHAVQRYDGELIGKAGNGVEFLKLVGQEFLRLRRQSVGALFYQALASRAAVLNVFPE